MGGHSCDYFYDKLGNITVQLGNEDFTLMPKGYLLNGADLDVQFKDACIFGVMPLPGMVGNIQMFLLGDVFLRNFYSVYDFYNQKVRLAANLHSYDRVGVTPPVGRGLIFCIYSGVLVGTILVTLLFSKLILKRNEAKMLDRVHNRFILEEEKGRSVDG